MTFGKGAALALGFVGGIALGVWVGPYMTATPQEKLPAETAVASPAGATTPSDPGMRRASRPAAIAATIPVTAPALQAQLKPLLYHGTNMNSAADGFKSAEQFAAVAHASFNTQIPFQVLKDGVVVRGRSLESAIHESNPRVNAATEAGRARTEAALDMTRLRG